MNYDEYEPELPYPARMYEPFATVELRERLRAQHNDQDYEPTSLEVRGEHFCRGCKIYYLKMNRKGATKDAFPAGLVCDFDRRMGQKHITRDLFDTDEEFELAWSTNDPVTWGRTYLNFTPRWYQEEILLCSSRYKVIRAGRRSGKSEAAALYALFSAWTKPRFEVLIVCPYESQVDLLFKKIRALIERSAIVGDTVARDKASPPQVIEFTNGSTIIGFSAGAKSGARSNKIRGQGGGLIIVDELDYLEDEDVQTVMAILIDRSDTELVFSSTPTGVRKRLHRLCFPSGTPIMVPGGVRAIEEFRQGDDVLGFSGYPERVSKLFRRGYEGSLVAIAVRGTFERLVATPEHPVLVLPKPGGNGRVSPRWTAIADVRPGDFLGVTLPKYDGSGRIPYPTDHNDPVTDARVEEMAYAYTLKNMIRSGYSGARDERRNTTYRRACAEVDRINSDPKLYRDFMEILGYWLAEGSIGKTDVACPNSVAFTFRKGEEWSKRTEEIARRLWPDVGVRRVEHRTAESENVWVFSSHLALIFLECCGALAEHKRIHPDLLASPDLPVLIEAYYRGDGFLRKSTGSWSCVTVSRLLADQVWRFHLSRGERASLYVKPAEGSHLEAYTVHVPKRVRSRNLRWYAGMPFLKVSSADVSAYKGEVFNLETTKTHTYSAKGFAVHNCTDKDDSFKEFWYISAESPSWSAAVERQLRSQSSEGFYAREFYAEFGEELEGVFRGKDIAHCLKDYDLTQVRRESDWIYCMGVDWNKITGTHIVVVGRPKLGPPLYKLVDKKIIRRSEFTQLSGVDAVMEMDKKWGCSFLYVDRGYGEVQVEIMHKRDEKYGTTYKKRLKSIDMGGSLEIISPLDNQPEKKPTKGFMVDCTVRGVEQHILHLPKSEDTDTEIVPTEVANANIGVVQQMRAFKRTKLSPNGKVTFSDDYEHTLTALMLAIMAHALEYGDYKQVNLVFGVSHVGGMGTPYQVPTHDAFGHPLPPQQVAMMKEAIKKQAEEEQQKARDRMKAVRRGEDSDKMNDVPEVNKAGEYLVSVDGVAPSRLSLRSIGPRNFRQIKSGRAGFRSGRTRSH